MNLTMVLFTELGFILTLDFMKNICFCMLGFCIGGLRVILYEFITEVSHPTRATVAIGLLHTASHIITLGLTVTADRIYKSHEEFGLRENIFNDIMQFLFLIGLTISALHNIKHVARLKRKEEDLLYEPDQ